MATITQTQQARLDDMIREQGGAGNVLDKINRGSIGLSADWHDGAVEYLQGQAGNDGAPPAEPAGDGGTGDAAGVVSESAGDGGTGDAAGVVLESVGDGGTGDAAGVVSESAGDGGTGDAAGVVSESAGDGGTGDAAGVVSDTTDVSDAVPANAMTPTAASNELNSIMADGIHFDEYDRLRAMAADPHTSSLVLRVGEQEMTVGEYLAGLGIGSPDYSVTLNWEDDDGYNQSYTLTASGDIGFGGLNLIRKRIHWLTDPDDDTGELPALSPEQEQELAFLRRRLSEAGSANTDREWDRLAGLTVSDLQANPSLASPEHDDRTFSRLYSSRYLDSMLGKMAAGTITPEEAWQLNYTLAKMNAIDPGVRRLLEGLEEDRRGRSSKRLEARNQRNRNTAIAQIAMSSGLTFAEAEWLYKGANFTTSDDGTKQGNPDLVAAIIAARPPDAPAPAAAPTSAAPTSAAPTDRILLKVGGESLNHDQSVQYLRSTYGLSDAEITAMSAENSLNEFLADETNSPGFQAWAAEVADQAGISVAAVVQSFKQGDIPYERRGDNTLAFVADDAESLGWTPGALSAPQPYAVDNSDLEMAGWTPYSDAGGETRFVPPETQDWIVATADAAGLTPQQVYQSWRQGDIQQEGDDFGATAVQSASGQTFIIPAEAEGPDWRMGAAEQIAPGVFVVTTTRQVPLVTSAPGIDDESAVTNADILAGQQAKADAAYPAITADAASANEQLAAKQRESEEGVADKTFDMLALTGGATVGAAPLFAIGPDLLANAETLASENKDLFFEIERWRNQIDPETGKTPAEMWQEKYLTEGAVDQILDWVPGADLFPRGGMNLNEAFRDPASPGGAAITPTEAKMLLITAGGEQAMGTLEGSTVVLDFITLGGATKAIKNFALKPAYRNMSKEAIERFAKKWGAGFAREFVLEEQGLEKPVQIMGEVGATGDHTNLWDRGKVHYAGYNPSTGKYEPLGVYIDDAIEAAVWSFLETTRDVGDMTDTEASAAFQQHLNETGVSGLINERLGGGGTSTSASAGSQTVAVTETVAPATTTVVVPGETEATPPDAATAVASTVAAPVETTVAAPVETTGCGAGGDDGCGAGGDDGCGAGHHDRRSRGHHDRRSRGHHDRRSRGHHDRRSRGHHDRRSRGHHDRRSRGHHDRRSRGHHDRRSRGHHDRRGRGHHDRRSRGHHDRRSRGHHDRRSRGHCGADGGNPHGQRRHGQRAERRYSGDWPGARGSIDNRAGRRPHRHSGNDHDRRSRGHHDRRSRGHHDRRSRGHHDRRGRGHYDRRGNGYDDRAGTGNRR